MTGKESVARPESSRPLALAGLRIVLVDDTDDARELTAYLLRGQGATVADVSSAKEAHALVARTAPDVLVSDVAMPNEDGYSLIRRVRALPGRLGRTPAVALSAFDDDEDRRHALCAGFDAHLSKVDTLDTVIRTVRHVAQRRHPSGVRSIPVLPSKSEPSGPSTER